ncbi:uncharacterized protein LOC136029462 [Artemia franciscana]|uniref:Uncharacterized protein n=1 Tax=Artemia franciscana TaxID=6661 RepID=A0AA88HLR7_ARTSF|nr:hypothetical protein QYM36_015011 [Artemia franciscana]KAK2707182.1 hypothetical protein QYM36_015011 [Artemia franciscana]
MLPEETRPKLKNSVSIVVDDCDCDDSSSMPQASMAPTIMTTPINEPDCTDLFSNFETTSPRYTSPRGSISKEECDAKIQQIKEDVQNRRNEFARLLDEHEQVVLTIRRIESRTDLSVILSPTKPETPSIEITSPEATAQSVSQ